MLYDCFTFFNELDLLEIRLHELNSVVDKFVLVESPTTYSCKKKPLYFAENRKRFKPFLKKIIHIVATDMPRIKHARGRFSQETYQRNTIQLGWNNCSLSDIILISDVDEIVKGDVLKVTKEELAKDWRKTAQFGLRAYLYHLNGWRNWYRLPRKKSRLKFLFRPFAASLQWFLDNYLTPQHCRHLTAKVGEMKHLTQEGKVKYLGDMLTYRDAGWHFSTLGDYKNVIKCIESRSRWQQDNKFIKNGVLKAIEDGVVYSKKQNPLKYVKIDKTFPKYVQDNQSKFSHLIKKI